MFVQGYIYGFLSGVLSYDLYTTIKAENDKLA